MEQQELAYGLGAVMRRKGSVVLADGDKRDRAQAAETLRRGGFDVVEAETGFGAFIAARGEDVRLVVLETALPDMTGYEVCQELRREHGDALAIFFLSGTRTDPLDRTTGLLFGADDFIVKPFDANELMARVSRFVARTDSRQAVEDESPAIIAHLTEREREVLALLAEGKSQKKIALELSISEKTVSTHIQHLHSKLDVHSRAELVAHAYREGLIGAPETSVMAVSGR